LNAEILMMMAGRLHGPARPPLTSWPGMLERAVGLVRLAAPELDDVPLYFVRQSGTAFADAMLHGFTHPQLDRWLRSDIGDAWEGRGVAVVMNDGDIDREPAEVRADVVAALALHEVGHALADGWATRRAEAREPTQEEVARIVPLAAAHAREPDAAPEETGLTLVSDFDGHDDRWVRAALHLRARLEARGIYIPSSRVIGNRWGLQNPFAYQGALADEPAELADLTFEALLARPAPAAFVELWEEDRRNFYERCAALSVAAPAEPTREEEMSKTLETVHRLFDGVAKKFQTRAKQRADTYRELVTAIANGRPPAEEQVLSILDAAGMAPDQLRADVDLAIRRRAAREALDRARKAPALRQQAEATLAAAGREYDRAVEAARAKFTETATRPRAQIVECEAAESAGAAAESFLRETAGEASPVQQQQFEDLRAKLADAERRARAAVDAAQLARKTCEPLFVRAKDLLATPSPQAREEGREVMKRADEESAAEDKHRAEAREAQKEINQLREAIDALQLAVEQTP
jgi:hypothetical protein